MRAYIDVETTGISRSKGAAIVEVGVVLYSDNGEEIASYTSLCNPGQAALDCEEADGALAKNRITREEILAAPPAAEVAEALRKFLMEWVPTAPRHAFNVAFASKFLQIEPWSIAEPWGECVMLAAQKVLGLTRYPRLDFVRDHFSIPQSDAPRALEKARIAAEIHQRILRGEK